MRNLTKQAVLLNDTSGNNHWGCELTFRILRENLTSRGIDLVERIPVRANWDTARFREAIKNADIVIVNGEGSMHHARDFAKETLRVVSMKRKHQAFFLINTVYEENDAEIASLVRSYDKVWVRESLSLSALADVSHSASVTPDLLFWMNRQERTKAKIDVLFTDSVVAVARTALYERSLDFSERKSLYLTLKKVGSSKTRPLSVKHIKKIMTEVRVFSENGVRIRNPGPSAFCGSIDDLFGIIRGSNFVVTGRFHMVVLCILFGVPFAAVSSNSHKIEGLLSDAGLANRLIPLEGVSPENVDSLAAFTEDENRSMKSYVSRARTQINQMFDEIAAWE